MQAPAGKISYVVAVSGGVDSVVLLDLLAGRSDAKLIMAHFDHGIRTDSREDRLFVQELAEKYGLPFAFDEGRLGAAASEATARDARYTFLRRIKDVSGARSIVTAHHEDDVLETAILNLLRGTGRKGLSSLQSTSEIYRPLLTTPKANVVAYARANGLKWREDSSNADQNYLRNYVRQRLLARFDDDARRKLRVLIDAASLTNDELDTMLAEQLRLQPGSNELDRRWFIGLPHEVAREVIATWLRSQGITNFDRKGIERIVAQSKTLPLGKQIDVDGGHVILINLHVLALLPRDR